MPNLDVLLSIEPGALASYLTPGQEPEAMASFEVVGCLAEGMESGLPSFIAVIELPSGQRIVAQTSWRNMSIAAVALIATWGTP